MVTETQKIEFDPGFAPHILAFQGTVQYLYADINRFKNLSQKQMRFRQFYKKILDMFYNNVGFYVGCLMWASYIKTLPEAEISGNHCLGQNYDENENKAETQYLLQFTNLFPKDMKYFLNQDFSFEDKFIKIIKVYEEFLTINKGFVGSKINTDILLPNIVNTDNTGQYKKLIDESIKAKNLAKLSEYIEMILR